MKNTELSSNTKSSEVLSDIQAMIFVLQENANHSGTPFLKNIRQEHNQINLSVLVRIRQKKILDKEIYLVLVHETEDEVGTLELTSLTLNPEKRGKKESDYSSQESGQRLKEDQFFIVQNNQYNLKNIPLLGAGQYALALVSEKGNLNSLLDVYYFTVE